MTLIPELVALKMAGLVDVLLGRPQSFQACRTDETLKSRLQPFHH